MRRGATGVTELAFQRLGKVRRTGIRTMRVTAFLAAAVRLADMHADRKRRRMVLEGGSIDVNGEGMHADHRRVPAQPGAGA